MRTFSTQVNWLYFDLGERVPRVIGMVGVALPGVVVDGELVPTRREPLLVAVQQPRLWGERKNVLANSLGLYGGLDRGMGVASNLGELSAAFSKVAWSLFTNSVNTGASK